MKINSNERKHHKAKKYKYVKINNLMKMKANENK